mgnify:CR=1 FL=1
MASLTYLNFDLTFESNADGYTVRVTDSPAGQAAADPNQHQAEYGEDRMADHR